MSDAIGAWRLTGDGDTLTFYYGAVTTTFPLDNEWAGLLLLRLVATIREAEKALDNKEKP
jgi:hypothetical protein